MDYLFKIYINSSTNHQVKHNHCAEAIMISQLVRPIVSGVSDYMIDIMANYIGSTTTHWRFWPA